MGLNFSANTIQWRATDAVNTIYTVSGFTFQPKALRFVWSGISGTTNNTQLANLDINRGVGFASSTTSRRAIGSFSQNAAGSANCGVIAINNGCVVTVDGNGTLSGFLDLNSIGTTGFTLVVRDTAPQNIAVIWEAWGGSDITDVTIGDIAEPAATGTQVYAGVSGFTSLGLNQCVMIAGCQSTAALNTGQANDSGLCAGFATSTVTAQQCTICGNSDDGSATMDTDGYIVQGECLSMITVAGGNPNARATLSAWGTNSFTLNWLARGVTARRYVYMAIKGGEWAAGTFILQDNVLNNTTRVIVPSTNPVGACVFSRLSGSMPAGTSQLQDKMDFGTATFSLSATTNPYNAKVFSVSSWDPDGLGTSALYLSLSYNNLITQVNSGFTASIGYALDSIAPNSFVARSNGQGVANEISGYLTFGDQRFPKEISAGHPFIF